MHKSPDDKGIDFTAGPCQSAPHSLLRVCLQLGSKVAIVFGLHCVA